MKIRDMTFLPLLMAPIAPFALADIAAAETIAQLRQETSIKVVVQSEETLYFTPDATYELPVVVDSAIMLDGVNIPAGTVINGRLEPVEGGLRYVTTDFEAGGFRTALLATSDVLRDVKDPRETSVGSIATDAAIGAAGGAAVGAVIGNGVSLGEVIGGAAVGVVVGNVTAQRVVIVEPGNPIALQIQ